MGSAYEIPNLRFSGIAGAAIARRRFLSVDASGNYIQATATSAVIGVSSIPNKAGEVAEVYDGIVMIEAGGVIAAGDAIKSDAEGKAVKDVAGKYVALTPAAAAGELISAKVY